MSRVQLQFTEWSRESVLNDQSRRVYSILVIRVSNSAFGRCDVVNYTLRGCFYVSYFFEYDCIFDWTGCFILILIFDISVCNIFISIWDTRVESTPVGASALLLASFAHRHIESIVNFSTWSLTTPLVVLEYEPPAGFFKRPRGGVEKRTEDGLFFILKQAHAPRWSYGPLFRQIGWKAAPLATYVADKSYKWRLSTKRVLARTAPTTPMSSNETNCDASQREKQRIRAGRSRTVSPLWRASIELERFSKRYLIAVNERTTHPSRIRSRRSSLK